MTNNIFEIFNPGDRHWRENKDFEKVHVFTTKKGGRGPMQVDLDDGTIVLPGQRDADPASDRPVRRGARRAAETDAAGRGTSADQKTPATSTSSDRKASSAAKKASAKASADDRPSASSRRKGADASSADERPGGRRTAGNAGADARRGSATSPEARRSGGKHAAPRRAKG